MKLKTLIAAAAIAASATAANAGESLKAAAALNLASEYCGTPATDDVLMPLIANVANELGVDIQEAMFFIVSERRRLEANMLNRGLTNQFCASMRKIAYGK